MNSIETVLGIIANIILVAPMWLASLLSDYKVHGWEIILGMYFAAYLFTAVVITNVIYGLYWYFRKNKPKRHPCKLAKCSIWAFYPLYFLLCFAIIIYDEATKPKPFPAANRPELVDGFKDLSANATLLEQRIYPGQPMTYFLNNNDEKPFHWGGLALNTLNIALAPHNTITIYLPEDDRNNPQTMRFDGRECQLVPFSPLIFKRKATASESTAFAHYELISCQSELTGITLDNQPLPDAVVFLQENNGHYIIRDDLGQRGSYFKRGVNIAMRDDERQSGLSYMEADVAPDGKVQSVKGGFSLCNQKDCPEGKQVCEGKDCYYQNPHPMKLGQCDYPILMDVTLTDFRNGTANWYFAERDKRSFPIEISEPCRNQRLPYQVKIAE